jgi:hypothetical protein
VTRTKPSKLGTMSWRLETSAVVCGFGDVGTLTKCRSTNAPALTLRDQLTGRSLFRAVHGHLR